MRSPAMSNSTHATVPSSILLVDDDPGVRESLRRVLATEGWQIVTASTGEEALECLRKNEPDLMITDLRMKPIDGWDLLFHENLQRPQLPIFVITALSRQAANGAAQFAAEFFQKPVDPDVLLAAVRRYLAEDSSGMAVGSYRMPPFAGDRGEPSASDGNQLTTQRKRNNRGLGRD